MTSDESLALQAMKGDLSAFEELVNRYKNKVFALLYRMLGQYQEAEDVSQEVFLTLYQKLYQYDSDKKFAPWIYRIATNTGISALRRRKRVVVLDFDDIHNQGYDNYSLTANTDPYFRLEREELKEEIDGAIMQLPENYRMVIVLRFQLDLDNQEIASILGMSRENVEVRVHRARKALRKIILKQMDERGIAIELPANR